MSATLKSALTKVASKSDDLQDRFDTWVDKHDEFSRDRAPLKSANGVEGLVMSVIIAAFVLAAFVILFVRLP